MDRNYAAASAIAAHDERPTGQDSGRDSKRDSTRDSLPNARRCSVSSLFALFPLDDWRLPACRKKLGLDFEVMSQKSGSRTSHRQVKRGEYLFRAGDAFKCLYPIRGGFFKTTLGDMEGREQITGFFMGGEVLGVDGFGSGHYENSALALEDSEVHAVPYSLIQEMGRITPTVQRHMLAIVSSEIVRSQSVMLLLGSLRASARLAAFLVNLSQRYLYRGHSGADLVLRMTRSDIGSYLGLRLETVSRLFSAFDKAGLISVHEKSVAILDVKSLECLIKAHGQRI